MKDEPREPARCANCRLEIVGVPVLVDGQLYCCAGCARGGPCCCSYDPPEPAGAPLCKVYLDRRAH